ncbi:phospholipid-binding protein [Levilactobacillus paucivorans]|uniref:Phospholipid-binding protein n=1 Tax=Levilactobacillus paucivorans TaxID=616990 RepID=A0A0R2LS15_9LACO|nr:YbhB/YbcL family Raf kinase inhibitor-like protein [Levilactobacillus paucivorans]KRO04023.1 phospholipid-binding protein [Levilactobacillus paucivorans]
MKITVPTEQGGFLAAEYSKQAMGSDVHGGDPVKSFPISLTDVPAGTKTLALSLVDFDAVPVCGFPWIHWVAANFPGTTREIPADVSRTDQIVHVHGRNSNAGSLVGNTDPQIFQNYTGPFPPDADHDYILTVYALDQTLDLPEGFWLNDLMHHAADHTLATATFTLRGRA